MVGYNADKKTYFCEICKLNYKNKELAEQCQKWCSTHNSCNFAIARQSIEAQESRNKKSIIN
jgi:cell division septum initiation protein DivIVA